MTKVIIGVDPHKLSATIEVVDGHEKLLGSARFSTDRAGYTAMRTYAKTDVITEIKSRARHKTVVGPPLNTTVPGSSIIDISGKRRAPFGGY